MLSMAFKRIERVGYLKKISGLLFWKLFKFLTRQNIPRSQTTARLMKKNYVRSLLRYQERELFIGAIWWHVGFKQLPIFVTKKSTSPTTYALTKKLIVFIDSITSFSNAPLYFDAPHTHSHSKCRWHRNQTDLVRPSFSQQLSVVDAYRGEPWMIKSLRGPQRTNEIHH